MNEMVKNSVESRRTAIFSSYEITDEKLLKKIEDYFNKLNEFASSYDDVMKFETEFASSPLAKEYTDLFVEISKLDNPEEKKDNVILDELKYDAKIHARRKAYQETYDVARDLPVIGEAMNIKQHYDFFSRFKKNKKDE